MLKAYLSEDNKMINVGKEQIKKGCWIYLEDPNESELQFVSNKCSVPLDLLRTPLDDEERAHIERDDTTTLVVMDTPIFEKDEYGDNQYATLPIGLLFNEDYFITVCLEECAVANDFIDGRVKGFSTFKRVRNVLLFLQRNSTKFLQYLRAIDKVSSRVHNELKQSMQNKEILQMMALEKSLVYFATSLNSNEHVLEKVLLFDEIKKYPEDIELVDDVITENKQAIEMCNIYSDITSGQMDAFASLVSNNLNIVMKIFTMITIVLAIPTLIFSMWGINVDVPFEKNPWGFAIVCGIAVIASIVAIVCLFNVNGVSPRKPRNRSNRQSNKRKKK